MGSEMRDIPPPGDEMTPVDHGATLGTILGGTAGAVGAALAGAGIPIAAAGIAAAAGVGAVLGGTVAKEATAPDVPDFQGDDFEVSPPERQQRAAVASRGNEALVQQYLGAGLKGTGAQSAPATDHAKGGLGAVRRPVNQRQTPTSS